jgi:hypothetical protein
MESKPEKPDKTIEKVERSFSKRIHGLRDLSYDQRLLELGLPRLEQRRLMIDLQLTARITTRRSCNPAEMFFNKATDRSLTLRGHNRRLGVPVHSHGVSRRMFWHRVLIAWNELPQEVVQARNDFKTRLSVYLRGA